MDLFIQGVTQKRRQQTAQHYRSFPLVSHSRTEVLTVSEDKTSLVEVITKQQLLYVQRTLNQ